ncbi:PHF13 protein, partial [Cochlearius cochlearius]|nr:PHF13 protein [Cochlearius cochlearius]
MSCPAFPTSFYDGGGPPPKRKKPPAKKLILEQEVEKRVPLSAGKGCGAEQDGVGGVPPLEGQVPPVKEQLLEPWGGPPRDLQPNSLLEDLMKEEKDWVHGAQGTEKPAGDDPPLKEHDPCSGGRKSPSSCSTLDQSEGEDASRGSSQLSGECLGEGGAPPCAAANDDAWDLITCFCLKPFAGRPMIECNECATWIGGAPPKIRKSNVPEVFICQRWGGPPQEIRRSNRARTRGGGPPPVLTTIFLNWVLSYLQGGSPPDHSWGRVWGSPPPLSGGDPPPCASPPVESLGPKSALCFYSYFVL